MVKTVMVKYIHYNMYEKCIYINRPPVSTMILIVCWPVFNIPEVRFRAIGMVTMINEALEDGWNG